MFLNVSSGEQFTIVDQNSSLLQERTFYIFFENVKILTRWAWATKQQVGLALTWEGFCMTILPVVIERILWL